MKKVFITGGSGYIGSHITLELANIEGYEIVIFDNFKNGNRKAIERIQDKTGKEIKVIEGDLLNFSDINTALLDNRPHVVIHMAALIEAGLSVQEPVRFYENNVSGSINLLKSMQQNKIDNLIFSSTAAVYGTPENPELNETSPVKPESPYGASKLMVENIIRDTADSSDLKAVVLRYFNAAGANSEGVIGQDYPRPTHLMTLAIEAALGLRDKLTIYGKDYPTADGTCIRDYIHVVDLAKAHVKAIDYLDKVENVDTFNIGTGHGTSNLEVVKKLEEITGEFPYIFGDRRPGDPVAFYTSNTKAKELLGWSPEYTLEDMLKHAYEWKKAYPNGYKSME